MPLQFCTKYWPKQSDVGLLHGVLLFGRGRAGVRSACSSISLGRNQAAKSSWGHQEPVQAGIDNPRILPRSRKKATLALLKCGTKGTNCTQSRLFGIIACVLVKEDLAIRFGPGTEYPVIGHIAAGKIAQVTGQSANGSWWKIICTYELTQSCYISADPSVAEITSGP
ncbi:MAG TPA: SH3 domain-containing protein [Anaerolineales bacterium]|nr:SH3 domain-containing protein [Anaerolineales bacterium]